jgi:hypothetical protein
MKKLFLLFILAFGMSYLGWGQTTVFTDDFSTNTSATYTTSGAINASAWSVTRSGADWGARRNTSPQQLEETNDVGGTANALGWVYSSVPLSSFSAPYNTTLSSNTGLITWTFNFRTNRTSALAGFTSNNSYGMAMILVSTSNTPNTTGSGYAVVMGGGGTNTIAIISFNNGLQGTKTTVVGFGGAPAALTNYMSVKVTYNPTNNLWELFNRDDGASGFNDPTTGTLTSLGTGTNSTYTAVAMSYFGAYWQGSTSATQTTFYDNVTVTSSNPSIALSSANPAIPAGNITQGTNKNMIYKFSLAITSAPATLTQVDFTSGGTYAATDITKFQLWYNTADDLGTAAQIGTNITTGLGSGSHSFTSLSQVIASGATGYLWITTDVPLTATLGNTVNVSALTTTNLTFVFGTKSGTAYTGGDQTIVAPSSPNVTVTSSMTGFGSLTVNTNSSVQSYTVSGTALTNDISIVPPTGFEISTSNSPFAATNPITLIQSGGIVNTTTIYVRFAPVAAQVYNVNITHTSSGSNNPNLAVSGTGISPANPATLTAIASSSTQIDLTATANASSNDIVVVFNATGTFTVPTDGVAPGNVGDAFAGGTIQYKGAASSLTNQTGLTPGQKVYYKAFSNDAFYFYSAGVTANATTFKIAPTVQAHDITFPTVGNTSMTSSWTNGDGDRRIVIINTANSFTDPVDGTSPSSSTVYAGSGEQVVYNSTGSSVSVTGLAVSTTYWFRVYEYNNTGVNTKFLTATATNNPKSQVTNTPSSFFEDFEVGSKGAYAAGDVVCSMGSWNMTEAVIGNLAGDKKNGNWSSRLRYTDGTTYGILTMNFDKTGGAGLVKISHAYYGSDGAATWKLQISTDGGTGWSDVGSTITSTTTLTAQKFYVNQSGPVRFKVIQLSGNRLNIDDFTIGDYSGVTTWNGSSSVDWDDAANWDNGMPSSTKGAVIPLVTTNPIIGNDAVAASLTINSGATLTINSTSSLTVNGTVTLNGTECLIIKSNASGTASFIDQGISGTGTAKVERYLTGSTWHVISSPTADAVSGLFLNDYLMQYNESTHAFEYILPVNVPFTPVKGIFTWLNSTSTKVFSGPPNTGSQGFGVSRTYNSATSDYDGWNMVGNPYPSSTDLSLLTGSWTNVEATAWFWDPGAGNYKVYPTGGGGSHSNICPPGQGFFVHCNDATASPSTPGSGTVRFTNTAKTIQTETFLKSDEVLKNLLKIRAQGYSNCYFDELSVYFDPSRTTDYEPGYDALKFIGNADAPQIYTLINDSEKVSVNSMAFDNKNITVPMGFSVSIPASYTLIASNLASFEDVISIRLEDLKLNTTQDLRTNPVYNFTYDTLDDPNRFILHFGNPYFGVNDSKNIQPVQIYSFGNAIYIKSQDGNLQQGSVFVYDLIGKDLFNASLSNQALNRITPGVVEGYYVVKVVTDQGVYTGKVYLK